MKHLGELSKLERLNLMMDYSSKKLKKVLTPNEKMIIEQITRANTINPKG